MLKKILFISAVAVAVITVTFFFAWRLKFLEVPARIALQKISGQNAAFDSIEYKLFNRITINSLTIGQNFRCDKTTIYLNPLKLLFNLNNPSSSIDRVDIDKPWIKLDNNILPYFKQGETPGTVPNAKTTAKKLNDLRITWDKGTVTFVLNGARVVYSDFQGDLSIADNISGQLSASSGPNTVSTDVLLKTKDQELTGYANLLFENKESIFKLHADIAKSAKGDFKAELIFPVLKWKNYELKDSTGSINYSAAGLAGEFQSSAGNLAFKGKDFANCQYKADFLLSTISSSLAGRLNASANTKFGVIQGSSTVAGLRLMDRELGNFTFTYSNSKNSDWNVQGKLQPSNLTFRLTFDKNYKANFKCAADNKNLGGFTGCLYPLDLKVNLADIPVSKFTFNAFKEKIDGFISLKGAVGRGKSSLNLSARNWSIGSLPPSAWSASLKQNGTGWEYEGQSGNKDWAIQGLFSSPKAWNLDVKLNSFNIKDLMSVITPATKLQGIVTGELTYAAANNSGKIRANIDDLSIADTFQGKAKLACTVSSEQLYVQDFAFYSQKGTLAGNIRIGLTEGNNECSSNLVFRNFPIIAPASSADTAAGSITINGPVRISGAIERGKNWGFTGSVLSNELKLNDLEPKKLKAQFQLSEEQINIKILQLEKLFSGSFILTKKSNTMSGKFALKNIPLHYFAAGLEGMFEGDLIVGGTTENPSVRLNYSSRNSIYKDIKFNHSGTVAVKNKTVMLEKFRLGSDLGKEVIELQGKVYPELDISGKVTDLTAKRISQLAGIKQETGGIFNGDCKISGGYADPLIELNASGKDIIIGGMPVTEFKTQLSFQKNILNISNAIAKFADSELRITDKSTIILKDRSFLLNTDWRNVHLGPVDLFGTMKLAGTWNAPSTSAVTGPAFNININTDNLWLNQYKLDETTFGIMFKDNIFTFLPKGNKSSTDDENPLLISGNLDISGWPDLKFQRLALRSGGSRSFVVDGLIGANAWNFSMAGKSVSAAAISELLNLPVALEGDTDMNLIGEGNLEKPKLEGSINISGGMIDDASFDNLNLQFSVKQDMISLTRARLIKKDQFTVVANGFAPFFLTAETQKRVEKNPLDISFSVEQASLNLLTGISKDIKSATGDIRSQFHLTGTLASPNANGYLKIANGEITSKKYFDKMTNLNISLIWKNNLLTIEDFSGKIGEGIMALKGNLKFSGFQPEEYNLTWETQGKKGIKISIPQLPIPSPLVKSEDWELLTNLSHGEPRFQIKLTGKASGPLLSGWVELENTHLSYPPPKMARGGEDPLESFWPLLSWDLELRTGKNTWYDNELASVQAQGSLKLSDKGAAPVADGRVEALRGNVGYLGTEFTVKRAVLEIFKSDVYLEAEAETQVPATTAGEADTVSLFIDRAKIGAIKPRFVSKNNPDLTTDKVMARATGFDPETYSAADRDFVLRQSLVRIFDSTLATPFARNLLRKSGLVDNVRVQYGTLETTKPEISGNPTMAELMYGTKYSAEKYIYNNDLLFGYSVLFDRFENKLNLRQQLELSYALKNNWFLKGSYELATDNPSLQPDRRVTIERQWRFGWSKKKK